jgi:hypothetical protein
MLRHSLFGLSTLALMTATACAQEDTTKISGAETKVTPEVTDTATTVQTETKILDAAQVKTKSEAKLYAESEFRQADINKDGSVDKNEFLAYAVLRAPVNDPLAENIDEPVTASDETASMEEPANAEEQFAEISNGDEVISEMEMVERRVAQFDEADTNDDEQLDVEESKEFIKLSQLKPSSSTSL